MVIRIKKRDFGEIEPNQIVVKKRDFSEAGVPELRPSVNPSPMSLKPQLESDTANQIPIMRDVVVPEIIAQAQAIKHVPDLWKTIQHLQFAPIAGALGQPQEPPPIDTLLKAQQSAGEISQAPFRPMGAITNVGHALLDKKPQDIIPNVIKGYAQPEAVPSLVSRVPMTEKERSGGIETLIPRAIAEGVESYLTANLAFGQPVQKAIKGTSQFLKTRQSAAIREELKNLMPKIEAKVKIPNAKQSGFPPNFSMDDKINSVLDAAKTDVNVANMIKKAMRMRTEKRAIELLTSKKGQAKLVPEGTPQQPKFTGKKPVVQPETIAPLAEVASQIQPVKAQPEVKSMPVEQVTPDVPRETPKPLTAEEAVKQGSSAEEFVEKQPKVYHGSPDAFIDFDENFLGQATKAKSAKNAFFFSDNKRVAETYRDTLPNKEMRDLASEYSNLEKELNKLPVDSKEADIVVKRMEEIERRQFDLDTTSEDLPEIKEVTLDIQNPFVYDAKGKAAVEMEDDLGDMVVSAKEKGHDAIIIKNVDDSADKSGKISTVYGVFDKSKIKTIPQLQSDYEAAKSKPTPKEGGGNWRISFDEETDMSRKADILRAIADVSKSPEELQDVLNRVSGLPDEANIRWAVEQRLKSISDKKSPSPEQSLIEQAKGMTLEKFLASYNLFHGTPSEIEGGKLKFGAGKQLKKGGYMGGHFLTDKEQAAQAFQFGGEIYQAKIDESKIYDVNKNKKLFKNFIGEKFKNQDGEMEIFTKNHYDFMFPDGENADWSTVYADVVEHIAKPKGFEGMKIKEYAGGVDANTYQLWQDEIPIYTKAQLTEIWNKANAKETQKPAEPPKTVEPPAKPPVKPPVKKMPEPPEEPSKPEVVKLGKKLGKPLGKLKVKKVVREKTGQVKDMEEPISKPAAMKIKLKAQEKGSKFGLKAGIEEGKLQVREVMKRKSERKKLSDEVKKMMSFIKDKPTANLPLEYKDVIEEVKASIDFDKARLSNILKRTKESRAFAAENPDLSEQVKGLESINAETMTIDDLREVYDVVQQLYHSGQVENEFLTSKLKIKFNEAVLKGAESIKGSMSLAEVPDYIKNSNKDLADKVMAGFKELKADTTRPEMFIELLDKFEENGVNYLATFEPVYKGAMKLMELKEVENKYFHDLIKPLRIWRFQNERVSVPGFPVQLMANEYVGIYANSMHPQNMAHLEATGITREMVVSIKEKFPKECKIAEEMSKYFIDKIWPELDDVYSKLKGVHLGKIPEGYWHIRNLKDVGDLEAIEMNLKTYNNYLKTGMAKSFTKERAPESKQKFTDFGFIEDVTQYLDQSQKYRAYAQAVRDASKYIKNPAIKNAIINKYGAEYYKILTNWIEDIARGRMKPPEDAVDKVSFFVRTNAGASTLGLNISVASKQSLSVSQAIGYMGEGSGRLLLRNILKYIEDPDAFKEFVNNNSTQQRNRGFRQEKELEEIRSLKDLSTIVGQVELRNFKGNYRALQELVLWPIQAIDLITTRCIWMTAYEIKLYKTNGNEEAAKEWADKVIRRTQPQGGIENLPQIFKSGPIKSMLMQYGNQSNQNTNLFFESLYRLSPDIKGKEKRSKAWSLIFWGNVFGALMYGVADKKRIQKNLKEVAIDIASSALSGIVGVRQVISKMRYPWGTSNIMEDLFNDYSKAVTSKKLKTKLKYAGRAAGKTFGVPAYTSAERMITRKTWREKLLGGERSKSPKKKKATVKKRTFQTGYKLKRRTFQPKLKTKRRTFQ